MVSESSGTELEIVLRFSDMFRICPLSEYHHLANPPISVEVEVLEKSNLLSVEWKVANPIIPSGQMITLITGWWFQPI